MEEIVRNRRGEDPLAAVHGARRGLIAARTARLVFRREPDPAQVQPPTGRLARLVRTLTGAGQPLEAHGILDLDQPGAAYDYGEFAVTEIGAAIWGSNSGLALAELNVDPDCRPGPLWFLGAVEFLNGATDDGLDEVAGEPWRRIRVSADVTVGPEVRAAETAPAMAWTPAVPRPDALDLTVWTDGAFLRRIALVLEDRLLTLEFHDFGANVAGFDWTHLSTFRTNVAEDPRCRPNQV
ncbi:hypothetical protein GCM10009547_48290 [Sporichthya brevicatena]|uniref:Uncharacterized protein n=1 Tax=Sporichthya brevicatena TaxID=171442 RepID=A0ABN1HCK3_9ACTN